MAKGELSCYSADRAYAAALLYVLVVIFGGSVAVSGQPETQRADLFGLKIDENAQVMHCRSVPFLVADPTNRGRSERKIEGGLETIPVGASADALCLLGMINDGWDYGVDHWAENPEMRRVRDDQVYIGCKIGDIEIRYADGTTDTFPVTTGATAWYYRNWVYTEAWQCGEQNWKEGRVPEPFHTRPELLAPLKRSLKVYEQNDRQAKDAPYNHYYLVVKPWPKKIESIIIRDNPAVRGRPLVSAITLVGAKPNANLVQFGKRVAEAGDLKPVFATNKPGNWNKSLNAAARALYTNESDLPKEVELLNFPRDTDAARIRFLGGTLADMLSNIWVVNLAQMDRKFDAGTGAFKESEPTSPTYGGYYGMGTWFPYGVYSKWSYSRCAEEYAPIALRHLNKAKRNTSFVDYVDSYLYFFRANHDPDKGPDNHQLNIAKYPKDAPPHWSFFLDEPYMLTYPGNEIDGYEETDGHGGVMIARWLAWRNEGCPTGDWLTAPRSNIYGKSRWDSTKDAAEFICWFMDYTGMDVIYCEGEGTGNLRALTGIPPGMANETDPVKIKHNYANSDAYDLYAAYNCLNALRCSAQIADAKGEADMAKRWRAYADRIESAAMRLLLVYSGTDGYQWKMLKNWSTGQSSLSQVSMSMYLEGLDPNRWKPQATQISRNTLKRQLGMPYGFRPCLAMGYGQGWLTQCTLLLDDVDSAGELLTCIAKYSYDKNMNYIDEARGIDWREYQWQIPEGSNLMPNGMWHRTDELSNGANQGIVLHALAVCAGVDDSDPGHIRILPRAPKLMTGIEVTGRDVVIAASGKTSKARVSYRFERPGRFTLSSDTLIPDLSVRLGPFDEDTARRLSSTGSRPSGASVRVDQSGQWQGKPAWWIWVEGMREVTNVELGFI